MKKLEIGKVRCKLNEMIISSLICENELLQMSQDMDKLIVGYIKEQKSYRDKEKTIKTDNSNFNAY